MAANKPASKTKKVTVNLSTADFALDHYIAVTTAGEPAGVEQLFAEDFSQKVQSANAKTNRRDQVVKYLKKQKGAKLNCVISRYPRVIGRLCGRQSDTKI